MNWKKIVSLTSTTPLVVLLITQKCLAVLLFVYTQGVFSGRKIVKLMIENLTM
ncbi:hypothetical protein SCRDD08_00307 [Streptococcus cristatus]|uniref:Uncharacterized protein n=1 Tax=Streptococcus cristatus TaxID=45634 RepID=A0A139N4M9_STRCR|nr:hypothetical protein SCRDD08_00307 [Streptococcus cristatus]